MKRRMAAIEVVGPIRKVSYWGCRRCGGPSSIWQIVGIPKDGTVYVECDTCGMGEVVIGTPMQFGELPCSDTKLCIKGYNQYRESVRLPLLNEKGEEPDE